MTAALFLKLPKSHYRSCPWCRDHWGLKTPTLHSYVCFLHASTLTATAKHICQTFHLITLTEWPYWNPHQNLSESKFSVVIKPTSISHYVTERTIENCGLSPFGNVIQHSLWIKHTCKVFVPTQYWLPAAAAHQTRCETVAPDFTLPNKLWPQIT